MYVHVLVYHINLWAREIISKNSEIWKGGGKNNLYVEIKMWEAGAVNLKHLIIIEHDIGYRMYANIYSGLWIIYCTKLLLWNIFIDCVDCIDTVIELNHDFAKYFTTALNDILRYSTYVSMYVCMYTHSHSRD